MRVLALDVGNTVVHATHLNPDSHEVRWSRALTSAERQREWATDQELCDVTHCVVGSVGPGGEEWLAWARERGWSVFGFLNGQHWPGNADVREPSLVGVDRLAAGLAAHARSAVDHVVVDLGTAFTVDWVDALGVFRGGAIVPGRRLCTESLHCGTRRLPALELWSGEPLHLPGRDTEEAIRHGLDRGLPALVDALVHDLETTIGAPTQRFLTGGDAAWYERRTDLTFEWDPHLVARGLWEAARRLEEQQNS